MNLVFSNKKDDINLFFGDKEKDVDLVGQWSNEDKLEEVVQRAAKQLPADVAKILLGLIQPEALAIMVGVLAVWGAAHFTGAGEIADVILIVVGVVTLGSVALEAGNEMFKFATTTLNATSDAELSRASHYLARGISLIGVEAVMALLLKKRPGTFTHSHNIPMKPLRKMPLLRRTRGWFYKPKITFTKSLLAGEGRTVPTGDIRVGRDHYGNAKGATEMMRLALYHEKVHSLLTPKLQIFREFRTYISKMGYSKSYILRYLEEALAETYAQLRVHGMGKEYIFSGIKFPIGPKYEISISLLKAEAKGVLLGPINVGGMIYNVYQGIQTEPYEKYD